MFLKIPKKYNGFSKVELLVGIAVLAILLLLAIPQFLGYTREAETTKLLNNGKIVESAVARYQITNEQWPKAGVAAITPSIMTLDGTMIHQDNPEIAGKTFYAVDRAKIDRDINRIDTTRFVVDGGGIVYILNPNHIRVTGIRLNPSSLLLRIGETADVNASVEPRNASVSGIVWETSDATIASVDNNGIITAHAAGQVAIGAYSLNYLSYSGTVSVTVIPAPAATITMTPSTNINTTTSVTFMHNTESNGVAITGAEWQLNNEAIVAAMPSRTFDVGSHTIRLRVQDANGTWSEWVSRAFDVVSLPVATITMTPSTNINTTTNVIFTHNATSNGVAIAGAEWQVNSEAIVTTSSLSRTFSAGNHVVRLRIQDANGAWSGWVQTEFFALGHLAAIASGSVALRTDGTVLVWGVGRLGGGLTQTLPIQVPGLTRITSVTAASNFFAVGNDGTAWGWGHNDFRQLNSGTATSFYHTPMRVQGLVGVSSVEGGIRHSLALKNNGDVWAWGNNWHGQLGNGTTTRWPERWHLPAQVPGLTNITAIGVNWAASLALRNDGTVWRWGDGRLSPTQIPGLTGIIAISANARHSLALRNDGTVWGWGELRLPHPAPSLNPYPIQINIPAGAIAISAGFDHSLALLGDGTVWAWGNGREGQLGNTLAQFGSNRPVRVMGLTDVTSIAAGGAVSRALRRDGSYWAWGENNQGQLGDGTTIRRTLPTQIPIP